MWYKKSKGVYSQAGLCSSALSEKRKKVWKNATIYSFFVKIKNPFFGIKLGKTKLLILIF